jgi:putative hemolysin
MQQLALEALLIFLLIVANGVFAMAEIAIVSARKVRLRERAGRGDAGARVALELADAPGPFLSTVQVGITLIGILAGALGGATIAEQVAAALGVVPALAPYADALALGLVVAVIAYLSLIVGELVPKRLALGNAEGIAARVAPSMRALARLATPLVRLLDVSSVAVIRLLRVQPSEEPLVTEAEVYHMIDQGTQVGVFEPTEQAMVRGVLRLGDRPVAALLTPRPAVAWLDVEDGIEAAIETLTQSRHNRFPVADGDLDRVLGIVHAKEVLAGRLSGELVDLRALVRPALFIPERLSILGALDRLKEAGAPMALVIDEYGGLQGLVTLNDVLEAIVGAIEAPDGPGEPEIIAREDGSWLLDGTLSLDAVGDLLPAGVFAPDSRGTYHTLGGFMMAELGRIPSSGDHLEQGGWRFEVMDMDGRRVDKVLLEPVRVSPG